LSGGRGGVAAEVLDLGCGMGLSGTVAASMGAHVLFADLEAPPLLLARLNSIDDAARVRARQLDWRRDKLGERFDMILGADIIYERSQWTHQERFWRQHLAPGAPVVLAEPHRQTGDMFMPWIKDLGWKLAEFEEPVETRPRPIRVFTLRI
jgi:predicted nicotinamide N-methyase